MSVLSHLGLFVTFDLLPLASMICFIIQPAGGFLVDLNVLSCGMAVENEEENVFDCWLILFFAVEAV